MTMSRRSFIAASAALLAMQAPFAQEVWPNRTVTFLLPYPPGTALDGVARFLSERLSQKWNTAVVVENKAGANGVIGTEVAAHATDGHTFLFTGPGHFTNEFLMPRLPFDPARDFKPVARLASVMLVLVVPTESPFKSVQDLIEYGKANPGKLSFASGGSGSSQHVSAATFCKMAGMEALHVPYKTQTQAVVDTVSGQVSFAFSALTTSAAPLKSGKLRALAVTGPRRSQSIPDLPTIAESGLPGYDFFSFNAVFAPLSTPDVAIRAFSEAAGEALRSEEFMKLTLIRGIETDYAGLEEWTSAAPQERKKWAEMIKVSGAKVD